MPKLPVGSWKITRGRLFIYLWKKQCFASEEAMLCFKTWYVVLRKAVFRAFRELLGGFFENVVLLKWTVCFLFGR